METLTQIRLVAESLLSPEEARTIAEDFLEKQGYRDLTLLESETRGAVQDFRYARTEGDAVCLDNTVSLAIALDDGSLYRFDACRYCPEPSGAQWTVDRDEAARALPESLRPQSCRAVILQSPGKRDLACWAFSCLDGDERSVTVYVDAATGEQCEISL
ncbi:MAG: germination protein YpeB [Oscillospiraceae bacterium]|nr:germination protein YpeB [Oscillospiraceae bacterium]